ncbi:MAG: hypothetical protein COV66_02180 [Nitrospinae bacterium CG11_big_fil_rev_8_21_14_0_20_45_15]|nr:MAG: hypothetical protein COV66_02180 [Nitrospinae bacterium CG11_big_fil_rev_8_21_14_0_20_45_15]
MNDNNGDLQSKFDSESAHAYVNYLLTLSIRKAEAFGALAYTFIKEQDLDQLKILPEEQFSLTIATVQSLTDEPKRYGLKINLLEKALALVSKTRYYSPAIVRQIEFDIKKTKAELDIYRNAMRPAQVGVEEPQTLVVESDVPSYFLCTAKKRASEYYLNKFRLSKEAKTAQNFSGTPRSFDPNNSAIQKEFSGACAPFMNSRINAFHILLPFDLKISRTPDNPLEAGVRAFYAKVGYSFPLAFERDKFCSYHDGEVLDIEMDDPHLLFISVSAVKEREFPSRQFDAPAGAPAEFAYPINVLDRIGTLGPYVQIPTNFKIWFDSSRVSLLIQGAPDLYEYGLNGGAGLMTRTHASDKTTVYNQAGNIPWQEGMSFNFANIHLLLDQKADSAFIPFNTPLFSVFPVLANSCFKIEDSEKMPIR